MRFPEFLRAGDTIGFTAPSFGCSIEPYRSRFDSAQERFRQMGHRLVCSDNVYADDGIGISTAPDVCARQFTGMYCSEETRAVISCGGGEMMCEILKDVDFAAIAAAKPKWFMGYSDNTNLCFTLATLCDTASIYGPGASSFGMKDWHPSLEDAYRLLRGEKLENEGYPSFQPAFEKDEEDPLAPYLCTEPRKIVAFDPEAGILPEREGSPLSFSGRLIGGCLDCLQTLCGTEFDRVEAFSEKYRGDGLIWFLEACDLNVFGIRRAVWQLKHSGWFRHVKGFLIGRPLAGQEDLMGLDHIRAVTDILGELQVPILLDLDIGHLPPMMPLMVGSLAEVTYRPEEDAFSLKMKPE